MENRFYLPVFQLDAFKKFIRKYQKNVDGVSCELSKEKEIVIRHATDDGQPIKMLHKVVEVTMNLPEENNWKLVTFFENDYQIIVEESKELIYWNQKHGKDYGICDACGHRIKNSYVIRNESTHEELQVGCECLKTYGIHSFKSISRMLAELHEKFYSLSADCDNEAFVLGSSYDPMKKWGRSAILKSDLICAAKSYYDEHPAWISAKNSEIGSMNEIKKVLIGKEFTIDDEYVRKVCEYSSNMDSYTEFSQDMVALCKNYYATPNDACAAYFLVKRYEEYVRMQLIGEIKEGTPVHIVGTVVHMALVPSMYGFGEMQKLFTIKTDNGVIVKRYGVVKYSGEGDNRVSFYSSVKYIKDNQIFLDRALKNPKKEFTNIIEL